MKCLRLVCVYGFALIYVAALALCCIMQYSPFERPAQPVHDFSLAVTKKRHSQDDDVAGLHAEAPAVPHKNEQVILIDDVGKYIKDPNVPYRRGIIPFTRQRGKGEPQDKGQGTVAVEARYSGGANGLRLEYILQANLDSSRLGEATLNEDDLRDVRIRYRDDWEEGSRLDSRAIESLIAELYLPCGRMRWDGLVFVPGGELLDFSTAMKKLILLGATAREPLERLLDDNRVQNEVVLILGAIGDESTVPLLIDRHPKDPDPSDWEQQKKTVCFSFALSYLTGHELDRSRYGTDLKGKNAELWRNWWSGAKSAFRVPTQKPNATWVPSYPHLTEEAAIRLRLRFARTIQ